MKIHVPINLTLYQEIETDEEIDCIDWSSVSDEQNIAEFARKMSIPASVKEEQWESIANSVLVSDGFCEIMAAIYKIRLSDPSYKAELSPCITCKPAKEV